MATTTNYGWTTPDDTALVKDGASAIRTLGSSIDTTTKNLNPETTLGDIAYRSSSSNTNTRLPIGSSGQVLTVAAGVPSWATPTDQTPLTTKGDLFTFSTVDARVGVGANGTVLTADSAEATGLKWAAPAASGALTKISTTTFTSTASSSITGCFSATYNNYLIICSDWINSAGDANVSLFLRTGGSNATTNYIVNGFYNNNATVTGFNFTDKINSFFTNASVKSASVINIQSPFLTKRTTFQCENTGRQYGSSYRGLHDAETSYADLGVTVDANTGSGVITIYGYSI